jgi:hypothetical protein
MHTREGRVRCDVCLTVPECGFTIDMFVNGGSRNRHVQLKANLCPKCYVEGRVPKVVGDNHERSEGTKDS